MRLSRLTPYACIATLLFATASHTQINELISQETVLSYLDQVAQWQREAVAIEPTTINAREIVFRDSLRENATKVLQNSFVFMRSVASTEPASQTNDPESTRQKITLRANTAEQGIRQLQAQMMKTASAASRASLKNEIKLETARLELMRTILANLNAASNKSPNKLMHTIDSLSRSIPELNPELEKFSELPAAKEPAKRSRMGILSLSADVFDGTRQIRELDAAIDRTAQLKKQSMELMKSLRRGLGEPGSEETEVKEEEKVAEIVAPLSVEDRVMAYQQIGAHIVPLGETMRWMDASKQTMKEWREVLQQQRVDILSRLGIRLGIVLFSLAITFCVSELIRRALKRIPDQKRKRQLNTVRRLGVGLAVLTILLLNFISDFGSFATFAGFLTAGLAVALQSVLLSLVAHFLFYGRYGVRNGDRVNVAGVTGDIVQIGMVRFYLRELVETDEGLVPTGKIVAFPNSIIFQNVAFYKYTT